MKQTVVMLGAYTAAPTGRGKGVTVYTMEEGRLVRQSVTETVNPSYLTMDASGTRLYAVNELKDGAVSAFDFDRETLSLRLMNSCPVHGADPCHLAVDAARRRLYCAAYSGSSMASVPLAPDGSLGGACDVIHYEGHGADPVRQRVSHPHGTFLAPDGRFLYVPDLGMDVIRCYRTDGDALRELPENAVPAPAPGQGPRHMAFHPDGKWCYFVTEMGCTVNACLRDADAGTLRCVQTLSTLPQGADRAGVTAAAVKVHPQGGLLYVSNRGHDSLAAYRIDRGTGRLTFLRTQKTGGRVPRDFGFTPSGEYLIAAHQESDDAVVFRVNPEDGMLSECSRVRAPSAVCVMIRDMDGAIG